MRDGSAPVWGRRTLLAGMAAALVPGRAWSQDEPVDEELRLLTNLFTRVAGLTHINRRGPFRFVIDTGAALTAVSDKLAAALALPPGPDMRVHGIASAEVRPSAHVGLLAFGDQRFRDLRCPVLPESQLGADGLIGLDALARFRLTFDITRRSARLSRLGSMLRTRSIDEIGTRLPGRGLRAQRARFGQLVFTQVEVGGQTCAAFVDSGAQYSIGNPALRSRLGRATGSEAPITIFGVTGQSVPAELSVAPDLRVGPNRLGDTPLLFADLHCFHPLNLADRPALLIGADLLSRFREVTLDFRRGGVDFEGLLRPSVHALKL